MELRNWIKKHGNNIARIGLIVFFLVLAIWAITLGRYDLVIGNSEISLWLTAALVSVGPELAGIVIGVVTIDYLNERRQEEQLKKRLILQLGSPNVDVTDTAMRALRSYGWLSDGSLKKAYLVEANLEGANLFAANLEGANLTKAKLEGANLTKANLEEASLAGANLIDAKLMAANLKGVILSAANLKGANLNGANLEGADMGGAILEGTVLGVDNMFDVYILAKMGVAIGARNCTVPQLLEAHSLKDAILPDGRKYDEEWVNDPEWREWMQEDVEEYVAGEIENVMAVDLVSEEE